MTGITKTERVLRSLKEQRKPESKQEIGTDMFLPNLSGDHSAGIVRTTPTDNLDIANKKYVDDSVAALGLPLSHTNPLEITDVGTNTHAQVDTHIAGTGTAVHGDSFLLNTGDTGTGSYTLDSPTFHVDSANHRVGIGTTTPGTKIDVNAGYIRNYGSGAGLIINNVANNQTETYFPNGAATAYINALGGNVGIGTTSPGGRLDTVGRILTSGASGEIALANRATNALSFSLYSPTAGYLGFYDQANSQERMTILGSGNVGIGTTSPNYKLEVTATGAGWQSICGFGNSTAGEYPFVFQQNGTTGEYRWIPITLTYNLDFVKADGTSTLYLDHIGRKVGIKTTSPGQELDVRGGAVFNEDSGDYDFRIESNDDANMFVLDAGLNMIGIRTNAPTSTHDVNGSISRALATYTANHTVSATDCVCLADATGGWFTSTLPAASSCKGRIYYFKCIAGYEGPGSHTIAPAGFDAIETGGPYSIGYLDAVMIQSDGVFNWWVIGHNP